MSEQTLDEYTRCGIPAIRVLARELIALRVRVLEGAYPSPITTDLALSRMRQMEQRAETAERERDAETKAWRLMKADRDAALAKVERLREYARHLDTCEFVVAWRQPIGSTANTGAMPCTCGLTAALEGEPA